METTKNRIDYIDVAKAIGVFAIWLGHYGPDAGYGYLWVFSWHVPLFFFLSGCMIHMEKERTIFEYIKNKIRTILIPYVFLRIINTVFYILRENTDSIAKVKKCIKLIIMGEIRNEGYLQGIALWFLTCLFVMSIVFHIMLKLNNKFIILGICVVLMFVGYNIIGKNCLWNIDGVCKYIFFYCVGYMIFPYISKWFSNCYNKSVIIVTMLCIFYSALLFGKVDLLQNIRYFSWFIQPLIGIYVCILGAYILKDIRILQEIGRKSLYLCGTEDIMRYLAFDLVTVIGLEIKLVNPIVLYVLVGLLMYIDWKTIVCVLEKSLYKILKYLQGNCSK